ncbi:MAG: hypothetical protein HFI46_09360, partial [Lachnospiraceae bacterium]|nr:hypothetical protein [Lachnospiraceae bacterium]
ACKSQESCVNRHLRSFIHYDVIKKRIIIEAHFGTCNALKEAGVHAKKVNKISQESPTVMDLILGHRIDLVIDTPTQGRDKSRDGFLIRRTAIETGVNCITAMDTARALVTSLENKQEQFTLIDVASI